MHDLTSGAYVFSCINILHSFGDCRTYKRDAVYIDSKLEISIWLCVITFLVFINFRIQIFRRHKRVSYSYRQMKWYAFINSEDINDYKTVIYL